MPIFTPLNGSGAVLFDNNYVDEMRSELIAKILTGSKTLEWARLIPGVKNRISLNTLTSVGTPDDASCGWPAQPGDITLNQNELVVMDREIKDQICLKDLEKTFLGAYMKSNKDLPFIATVADEYVKTAKKDIETMIWLGNGTIPGLYQLADTATGVVDASSQVAGAGTMIAKVNAMVAAMPIEIADREDLVLCLTHADFMAYQQELIAANLFHYDANIAGDNTMYVPGTAVKVRAIAGLNNATAPQTGSIMLLTYEDNVAVGTDGVDDDEYFDIFYSREFDAMKAHISYKIGASFFFNDFVVKGYAI